MILIQKNFKLKSDFLGKGYTIRVASQNFEYQHDEVFYSNKERFAKGGSAFTSWNKYSQYTKTTGYPSWADKYVSKII
tara:strand:+ start:208 stop:441 length:234 start_codon:yes stop_codon:yes gene_type:complete